MPEMISPTYSHPDYISPEALKAQRAYADVLLNRSREKVERPAGAIGAWVDALTGNLERNRANELQSNAAAQNARRQAEVFSQLQSGQPLDPRNLAAIYSDPMASPETRALITHLIQPQAIKDVYNRPGFASPLQGAQAAPVQGTFQPGFVSPDSAPGVSTTSPVTAPTVQRGPVASSPRVWGDKEAQAAGLYPPSASPGGGGRQAPIPGPAPQGSAPAYVNPRLDAIAAKGREYTAAANVNQAGSVAHGDVIKDDIAGANEAANVLKGVGVIEDNIRRYGDKITFGPTSEWSLEMKRAAANYAPGAMKDQLGAIAAADSINKVGIQLAGTLAKQIGSGTQGEFYKALQGVPGLLTSKEGALAMADMVRQAAQKQQQLGLLLQNPNNWQNYAQLKQDFWRNNPIYNPLTGNPIELDASRAKGAQPGRARIISVE